MRSYHHYYHDKVYRVSRGLRWSSVQATHL